MTETKEVKSKRAHFRKISKRIRREDLLYIRKEMGIPAEGLGDWLQGAIWLKENENTEKYRSFLVWHWIISVRSETPAGFVGALREYILCGEVSSHTLKLADKSGCEMFGIEAETKMNITSGLYIKVSPNSNPSDIKQFVDQHSKEIKAYNTERRKQKKPKLDEMHLKNEAIYALGILNIKQIKDLAAQWNIEIKTGKGMGKYTVISALIKGLLGRSISADRVKKIYNEQKKQHTGVTFLDKK